MSDGVVAEALGRALSAVGPGLVLNPRQVRACLSDDLGQEARVRRAEIDAVVVAAEVGVGSSLASGAFDRSDLMRRMRDRAVGEDAATLAIETWRQALGCAVPVVPREVLEAGTTPAPTPGRVAADATELPGGAMLREPSGGSDATVLPGGAMLREPSGGSDATVLPGAAVLREPSGGSDATVLPPGMTAHRNGAGPGGHVSAPQPVRPPGQEVGPSLGGVAIATPPPVRIHPLVPWLMLITVASTAIGLFPNYYSEPSTSTASDAPSLSFSLIWIGGLLVGAVCGFLVKGPTGTATVAGYTVGLGVSAVGLGLTDVTGFFLADAWGPGPGFLLSTPPLVLVVAGGALAWRQTSSAGVHPRRSVLCILGTGSFLAVAFVLADPYKLTRLDFADRRYGSAFNFAVGENAVPLLAALTLFALSGPTLALLLRKRSLSSFPASILAFMVWVFAELAYSRLALGQIATDREESVAMTEFWWAALVTAFLTTAIALWELWRHRDAPRTLAHSTSEES